MVNFKEIIVPRLLRPRVIHRLPGRLRIHVPAIQYIPQQFNGVANDLINKLKFSEGIQSVDFSFISGNILIHYHVSQTDETTVMMWVSKLYNLIMEIKKQISKLPEKQRINATKKLAHFIKHSELNSIDLDRKEAIFEIIGN